VCGGSEQTRRPELLRAGGSRQLHYSLGSPQHRRIYHYALKCEDTAFIGGCGQNVSRPLHLVGGRRITGPYHGHLALAQLALANAA
jgi:hypothetical protein